MIESSGPKQPKISSLSILAVFFASLSFSMLFFSPFGPLSSSLIPFNPTGWAAIFVYLAMLMSYSQKYEQTKDAFWFILTLMFFPLLLSDLYFFPIPQPLGFGMVEWMGIHVIACHACLAVYGKIKILRYTNLAMLALFSAFAPIYRFPELGVPVAPFGFIPLLSMIIITVTLAYYAYQRMEYLMIVGLVLNFIFTGFNIGLYATNGILLFGWSQPFMAIVTDRVSIFGRILMVVSWPALVAFWAKTRNLDKA